MLLVLNQIIAALNSFQKIYKSFIKFLLPTYIVFSSPRFASSASLMKKNKAFIKTRKRIGRRIDKRICKKLSVSFILTLCFLCFKYE